MIKSAGTYVSDASALLKGQWTKSILFIVVYGLLAVAIAFLAILIVSAFHLKFMLGVEGMPDIRHADVGYALLNNKMGEYMLIQVEMFLLIFLFAYPWLVYYLPVKFAALARKQPFSAMKVKGSRAVGTTLLVCVAPWIIVMGIRIWLAYCLVGMAQQPPHAASPALYVQIGLAFAAFTAAAILQVIYSYAVGLLPLYAQDNPDESLFTLFARCFHQTNGKKGKLFAIDLISVVAPMFILVFLTPIFVIVDLAHSANGSPSSMVVLWIGIILAIAAIIFLFSMLARNLVARALLYNDIVEEFTAKEQPEAESIPLIQEVKEQAVAKESEDFYAYLQTKNDTNQL